MVYTVSFSGIRITDKQVTGRISAHHYALTLWFIKKRQVNKTTENPSTNHLFQLKGKVWDSTLIALLVQHHTQLWLSVFFRWYNIGSRLPEYVLWHLLKVHNFSHLHKEEVSVHHTQNISTWSPSTVWSFNSLIWKSFVLNSCTPALPYCRPYSALIWFCNWTSCLSAK